MYRFAPAVHGYGHRHILHLEFTDRLHPQVVKGDDPGRSNRLGDQVGRPAVYLMAVGGAAYLVAQAIRSSRLVAVMRRNGERAEDYARRHGVPRWYDDAQALVERVRRGEDFATLARSHSQDPGSASEGGDLGWVAPGQMVPEFEAAAAKTDVGEISDPVRTQFGWHILEVTDRRDHDMTDQASRAKATDYLHNRKYQEELDAWLRQIRDEAFVDIK